MGSRFNLKTRFRSVNMSYVKILDQISRDIRYPSKSFESFRYGLKMMLGFLGKECSPIVAQRFARGYRALQLHSKLWSNHVASLNRGNPNSRKWVFGFVMYSLCHPKFNVIEESELNNHKNDLDYIHELTAATVVCPNCKDRLVISKKLPNIKYCHCPGADSAYSRKIDGHPWTPFVETPDLLIWRQPNPDFEGLYTYKVYGYYDDITPEDFLQTQLDLEYRKKWDNLVLQLKIIDKDVESSSEVVYWEMKWPKMFSNRDYCFVRRHLVDKEEKTIVIISKAVKHPSCPEVKGIVRVREYWSVMQIKGVKGMNDRGVEFGLTYFDNPGLSLPTWLSNWAAMAGIPDFLNKVRAAARVKRAELESRSKASIVEELPKSEGTPPGSKRDGDAESNCAPDSNASAPSSNSDVKTESGAPEKESNSSSGDDSANKSPGGGSESSDSNNDNSRSAQNPASSASASSLAKLSPTTTVVINNTNINPANSGAVGPTKEQGEILSQFFKENFLTPQTSLNDG